MAIAMYFVIQREREHAAKDRTEVNILNTTRAFWFVVALWPGFIDQCSGMSGRRFSRASRPNQRDQSRPTHQPPLPLGPTLLYLFRPLHLPSVSRQSTHLQGRPSHK